MEAFFCPDCIAAMPAAKFWLATGVAALAGLAALLLARRWFLRARLIEDMPTSRIRSASQGYVELAGVADAGGQFLAAPLTSQPCLWWRFRIEKHKRSGKSSSWVTVERGQSDSPFHIRDTTGACRIEPAGAEISCLHRKVWYGSTPRPRGAPPAGGSRFSLGGFDMGFGRRYRYTEYSIRDGDPLYVLGYFHTDATGRRTLTLERLAGQIVRQWKQDFPGLLAAYDRNRDDRLDSGEWRAVRDAARKQALLEQSATAEMAAHQIGRPVSGGLPFLIGSQGEEQLSRRYRYKAFFSAAGFLLAGSLTTWLLGNRFIS